MRLSGSRPTATLLQSSRQRRWISDGRPFAPGDLVILRQKIDRSAPPILTKPLKPGRRIEGHKGIIQHDDIIGKRVRDIVKSSTTRSTRDPTEYRLHEVTLDEYTRLSRRLVTPIYPADANLIVALLDLHPDAGETEEVAPRLEILEAGTGHGALTLHLSRAIHAQNSGIRIGSEDVDEWKAHRRAIIHTTDISSQFAAHAQTVVEGFRRGIYARNVDFHVGDVSEVLRSLQACRDTRSFLSHAFLDMPAADAHLATVADALRTDGTLIVFNPSITQVISCATKVKEQGIPLDLEKVVELGVNGGSGGREWDVRFVRPRSEEAPLRETPPSDTDTDSGHDGDASPELRSPVSAADRTWSLVCRPKVGERIVGGGFLGVWKKQRDMRAESNQPSP
ncbi:hypothetical protein M409DRAFT_16878 [Zasmidium cellare ATCC 36951]|uniref:tRNA (adenine(58)-N(1))-methyltransferase catalytic subunit TRM61 n=1 Tax=Zasmidium cellare ATCC 36951 TaxID=1080233 RepID=A0A6A6D175_ZASCE|nr:uncharacterized protein M409DRAFT_16878 [Zasmidium cellare ATCC 36951]KAF2172925.1 hypothetical protein M409DRAFT_16878 [Zasmidium cellare ATCC 36951]